MINTEVVHVVTATGPGGLSGPLRIDLQVGPVLVCVQALTVWRQHSACCPCLSILLPTLPHGTVVDTAVCRGAMRRR